MPPVQQRRPARGALSTSLFNGVKGALRPGRTHHPRRASQTRSTLDISLADGVRVILCFGRRGRVECHGALRSAVDMANNSFLVHMNSAPPFGLTSIATMGHHFSRVRLIVHIMRLIAYTTEQ